MVCLGGWGRGVLVAAYIVVGWVFGLFFKEPLRVSQGALECPGPLSEVHCFWELRWGGGPQGEPLGCPLALRAPLPRLPRAPRPPQPQRGARVRGACGWMPVSGRSACLRGAGPGWGLGGGAAAQQDGPPGRALMWGKGQARTPCPCPRGGGHIRYAHVGAVCSGAAGAARAGRPGPGRGPAGVGVPRGAGRGQSGGAESR